MTELSRNIASRYTGIVLSLRWKDQDIATRALLENFPQCKNTTSLSYPSDPLEYTGGMKLLYLLYIGEIITRT